MTRESYLKNKEVIDAFAEGAIIEYRDPKDSDSEWTIGKNLSFDEHYEYRIKPFEKGEYVTLIDEGHEHKWISIYSESIDPYRFATLFCYRVHDNSIATGNALGFKNRELRKSTTDEILLLNSKLKEHGKFFNSSTVSIEVLSKHQDLIDEWEKSGKTKIIQFWSDGYRQWVDKQHYYFLDHLMYRFKPESVYAPFEFADHKIFRDRWLKKKGRDKSFYRIVQVYRDYCVISDHKTKYDYEHLFNNFEFEDGAIFGKLIEN